MEGTVEGAYDVYDFTYSAYQKVATSDFKDESKKR